MKGAVWWYVASGAMVVAVAITIGMGRVSWWFVAAALAFAVRAALMGGKH